MLVPSIAEKSGIVISGVLTWAMLALAFMCSGVQALAHYLISKDATRIERYAVGTFIMWVCFSIGWAIDQQQNPITGFGAIAGASGIATWLCYFIDGKRARKSDPIADFIDAEFK